MEPNMNVTADVAVICGKEILLIQRKNEPFKDKWCLPGGKIEVDEDLTDGAKRELKEEVGIKDVELKEIGAFGKPDRDPRGRVVSIAYMCKVDKKEAKPGSDAKEVKWFKVDELPELGFDHDEIVNKILNIEQCL